MGSLFLLLYLFSDLERKLRDEISIETSQIKTSDNEEKSETEENVEIGHRAVDAVCSGESAVIENEETVLSVALKGTHGHLY